MSVELIRLFVVLLATAAGHALGQAGAGSGGHGETAVFLGSLLGACVGYVAGGVLGRLLKRVMGTVEERVEGVPAASLLAGGLGAVACGALASLVAVPAGLVLHGQLRRVGAWAWSGVAVVIWMGVAEGWRLGRRKGGELVRYLMSGAGGSGGPSGTGSAGSAGIGTAPGGAGGTGGTTSATAEGGALSPAPAAGALVDTSAVIDGRLLPLARSGFLPRPLYVARFVLDEIQMLADMADVPRRRRARRGLEVLGALRHEPGCELQVLEDEVPELHEVDAKLVALARRMGVGLITVDGPLEMNAEIQGVRCYNLGRLADAMRPEHVPGEIVPVRLSRPGRERGQAVGFLDDGTMVVVADAAGLVGQQVTVRVTSGVATSMGRMLFAAVSSAEDSPVVS
jgi:uncharacterized protein YacL